MAEPVVLIEVDTLGAVSTASGLVVRGGRHEPAITLCRDGDTLALPVAGFAVAVPYLEERLGRFTDGADLFERIAACLTVIAAGADTDQIDRVVRWYRDAGVPFVRTVHHCSVLTEMRSHPLLRLTEPDRVRLLAVEFWDRSGLPPEARFHESHRRGDELPVVHTVTVRTPDEAALVAGLTALVEAGELGGHLPDGGNAARVRVWCDTTDP